MQPLKRTKASTLYISVTSVEGPEWIHDVPAILETGGDLSKEILRGDVVWI